MSFLPQALPTSWVLGASLLFLLKHFLADYIFQLDWMARGKEAETGWLAPLTAHVAVHAALTALIFAFAAPPLLWIAAVDFAVHFSIDRTKSLVGHTLRLDPSSSGFWWLMGFDQTLHHLTHLVFAIVIAAAHAG